MANGMYIGVGSVPKKVKSLYIGVGGVPKKVKKAYIGVGGVPKLFYSNEIAQPSYSGTYSVSTVGNYKYMYLKSGGTLTINEAGYDKISLI